MIADYQSSMVFLFAFFLPGTARYHWWKRGFANQRVGSLSEESFRANREARAREKKKKKKERRGIMPGITGGNADSRINLQQRFSKTRFGRIEKHEPNTRM